jgi:hypothetical protein
MKTTGNCGSCLRHCEIGERDFVACMAGSSDDPIWAERRRDYKKRRIPIEERPWRFQGIDPGHMHRTDGETCSAFVPGKDF